MRVVGEERRFALHRHRNDPGGSGDAARDRMQACLQAVGACGARERGQGCGAEKEARSLHEPVPW